MKKIYHFRVFLTAFFSALIIFFHFLFNGSSEVNIALLSAPQSVPTISASEHQKIMKDYISQIRTLNNRIFQLLQVVLDTPPKDMDSLNQNINNLKGELISVREKMRVYMLEIQAMGPQNRDILLLFNALNHTSNALFYIEQLALTSSNVDKVPLLEDFFYARSAIKDTVDAVEQLISEY